MVLPIVKIPAPILRTRAKEVTRARIKSDEIQSLIKSMRATMPAAQGIGLAAPQVGVSARIAVIAYGDDILTVINPSIVKHSAEYQESEEGCLSIPGVQGVVNRSREIKVAALDQEGKRINIRASGLLACVFQHEIDHLDGILFVDRVIKFLTPVSEKQKEARIPF